MEDLTTGTEPETNGHGDIFADLREQQRELQPVGKTKILEVPGYKGKLGIEYKYISTEVTEHITRKIRRETKMDNGRGEILLSSVETLIAACNRVMVVNDPNGQTPDERWKPITNDFPPIRLDPNLAARIGFEADDERETVLALFGSEHAIIQQNVMLSKWLTDVSREVDEDFLDF